MSEKTQTSLSASYRFRRALLFHVAWPFVDRLAYLSDRLDLTFSDWGSRFADSAPKGPEASA